MFQIFGIHTLLGLSAYALILTGQVSLAQAGFFGIGAYMAGIGTTMWGWHIIPALALAGLIAGVLAFLIGFPALRVKGLMLVIATLAFSEVVRLFFFNFHYTIRRDGMLIGPEGPEGFRQIRYFPENGWTTIEVSLFVWVLVLLIGGFLWWADRSRAGTVVRAVGLDELAAQSVGVNLTTVKVAAMTAGGVIAGIAGGLYAHMTTHVEHINFDVLLATFAIAYPIIGGLHSVFGTLVAVIFIQGLLVEGLRFLGDWRNLLFGLLIILVMNVRIKQLRDTRLANLIRGMLPAQRRGHAGA
jgi:branched-chain amino acid transport system permease protein